ALFASPQGLWGDGKNLYVADTGNQIIRRVTIATGEVVTIAGSHGSAGNDDGAGTRARFDHPASLWGDGINLYVVDGVDRIRKVTPAGVVSTIIGTSVSYPGEDGPCIQAIWGDAMNVYTPDRCARAVGQISLSAGTRSHAALFEDD